MNIHYRCSPRQPRAYCSSPKASESAHRWQQRSAPCPLSAGSPSRRAAGSGRTPRRSTPPGWFRTCAATSPTEAFTLSNSPPRVSHDAVNEQVFQPACEPVGEKIHRRPALKQGAQNRDQGGAHQDDAAARHELFHALALLMCDKEVIEV